MFRTTKPVATRVYTFLNTAVALFVLLAVFTAANWDQMPDGFVEFLAVRITVKNLIEAALFLLISVVAFRVFGLSRPWPAAPFWKELLQVTKACTVASVFALIFPLTSHSGAFTYRVVFYFLPVAIVACLCGRLVARVFADRLTRAIAGRRDLIIVGSGPRAAELYKHVHEPQHGYTRVLGFVDSSNAHLVSAAIRKHMLGTLEDLEGILMQHPVDEVLIALPARSCYDQIQTALQTCERAGVDAKYLSDVFQFSLSKPKFEPDDQTPVVSLKVVQDDSRRLAKRCIDVIGATVGLIIFTPVMLVIAAAIKLMSRGPVFFVHERPGLHGRPFRLYKFRTMVLNADERLTAYLKSNPGLEAEWRCGYKLKNDSRVTSIGTFLRQASLDELPQFFNVLRGDMSLVGPRPILNSEISQYGLSFAKYRQVLPGLTGLWQVSGRNDCSYEERVELVNKYVREWSLWLDVCLLARTVTVVLKRAGAY